MVVFEIVIALLLGGAALAALARRFNAPYPALVALAGAALALIPGLPTLTLDPELALALFIAPVLLDAAFDSSQRDLRANWRPIASLALGAVVLTVVVVAFVARAFVPEMPWAAAIALGAIVAPPDAASATAVLKQLRPPHRLLVILEGESLFNDASALLIYRLAVGAAITGAFSGWRILPTLFVVTVGSVGLGIVLAKIIVAINTRIRDVATSVIVQFCGTFGVWILAERLHLSGIITIVVFAMVAARGAPDMLTARIRIPAWVVWDVAVFVLNVIAFALVGFQLKSIAARATGAVGAQYAILAAAVCIAVILTRMVWVTGATTFSLWRSRRRARGTVVPNDSLAINYSNAAVVGWCGMRGTVTLAAALALPSDFPHRDLILVTAFGVTLGTLVLQGVTLRPLLLHLKLEDDGSIEREIVLARLETLNAALATIGKSPSSETTALVRQSFELQHRRAEEEFFNLGMNRIEDTSLNTFVPNDEGAVVQAAGEAQRKRLHTLRSENRIGDDAYLRVQEEIDWMEMGWAQVFRQEQET